jgi:homoserine trans-succinylase
VGPDGGGSATRQARATAELMSFLGIRDRSREEIVEGLFNRDSFSFYKGQIGGWQEVFTAEHRRLAEEKFGDVLSQYGYV